MREQPSDVESFLEELIDRTLPTFLQQVEDGTWTSGGWPQVYTDYLVSKLAVNAYTRLMARKLFERPEVEDQMTVNELIHHDHDNRRWKETLIRSIFSEHDAQQFLGIPLRMFPDQDRVVLKYSEDGWGVHGKIRIPCDNEEYGKSSKHSPVLFLDFFWKDIWSVIVAPKRRNLEVQFIKLNFDAACKNGIGIGMGVVCRDFEGNIFALATNQLPYVPFPKVVEVLVPEMDPSSSKGFSFPKFHLGN
ncbi:hypothetical protein D0Y65_050684 [Glycine soja]|uniref:Uncharacterized protein n=1 Tax=Glycine soja TaxID=3848 RepID=A0A445FCZ6_GLYSO|nr:hypothetical protein D0Y65_050684 [Glycine soja]